MIAPDKRKALFLLYQQGRSIRQIARQLALSRQVVRRAIAEQGASPRHAFVPPLDPELVRRLYAQCEGYVQRVWEKLREEQGVDVKYSTLTRWLRQLGIGPLPAPRCERVPDEPGAEMQHDTSPFPVRLGSTPAPLQASLLCLRYSKRRYLQFYRVLDRFRMKCFLHRALVHWGCAPPVCVIDNTNLARLRGLGAQAVIVPEMAAFARTYGFRFLCHAPRHSDRKAGEERSFWTLDANYYWVPGTGRGRLTVLRYENHLQIYLAGQVAIEYPLAAEGVRNQQIDRPDKPAAHAHPRHPAQPSDEEEKRLRALDPTLSAYVDFLLSTPGHLRHQTLRRLWALSQRMSPELFLRSVERAHRYRIHDLKTLEPIAYLYLQETPGQLPLPAIDQSFRDRPTYQDGSLTQAPNLAQYDE